VGYYFPSGGCGLQEKNQQKQAGDAFHKACWSRRAQERVEEF
jgi:hypothetical protein